MSFDIWQIIMHANELLDFIFKLLTLGAFIFVSLWYFKQYKKLQVIETEMRKLAKKLNGETREETTQRAKGFLINQSQLNKMVDAKLIPIKERYALLDMERRFILDRLPFVGIFKGS